MQNLNPDTEQVLDLIHDEKWDQINSVLKTLHPADIADIIDRAVQNREDEAALDKLRGKAEALCRGFPLYPGM